MLRIATLAALAATALAAPAWAGSIHVSTAGKTPEQVKAEVVAAASQLCRAESRDSAVEAQLQASCMKATVRLALGQADPTATLKISAR